MFNKFKYIVHDDGFFYGSLIVLVAISSFGLGRLSVADIGLKTEAKQPITVVQSASVGVGTQLPAKNATSGEQAKQTADQAYVGSKNGTKYHLPWCPGASQIKEENKVYFGSRGEAEALGYSPAANCKGI